MSDKITDTGDEKLLKLICGTSTELNQGLKQLYRDHYSFLAHYITSNRGSEQDAEDIFQEVMIAFVNCARAGKFRGASSIRTFLYTLNRNIWLNEIKRRERSLAREKLVGNVLSEKDADIIAGMEAGQMAKTIQNLLGPLGESCKKILTLFYFEEVSMNEIAVALNYQNEQVARNKKLKCLKKMASLVKRNSEMYQQLKNFLHG